MDNDLLAILGGDPVPAAPKPSKGPSAPRMDPTDALIRTVYGEAPPNATADEHKWIAATIVNRASQSGGKQDYTDVVLAPGQYEPWGNKQARKRLEALTPDSPAYQAIAANVADVLAGQDPSGGATHFYAPDTQTKLGRSKPGWDDGTGTRVGAHLFFRKGTAKAPGADLASLLGEQAQGDDTSADAAFSRAFGATPKAGAGKVINAETGEPATAPQEAFFLRLAKDGKIDVNAAPGSEKLPRLQVERGTEPSEPGAWFVTLDGDLKQTYDKRIEAQKAAEAGDYDKARKLYGEWALKDKGGAVGALANRWTSGALFAGKNELWAGMQGYFANEGSQGQAEWDRNFNNRLASLDQFDAEQHKLYPKTSDAGSVLGALTTSLAAPQAAAARLIVRVPLAAATGATFGGAQGFLGESGTMDQRLANAEEGAKWGAVLGPAAEGAGALGARMANSITGAGVSPEVAGLARTARDRYGINLRAGQISSSPTMKFTDSVLSRTFGSGYATKDEAARAAFSRAVASSIGETADGVTPVVMQRARTRLGNEFDRIGGASTTQADNQFVADLAQLDGEARLALVDAEYGVIERQIDNVLSKVNAQGEIPGDVYQALTRKGAPLDVASRSGNPNVRHYASEVREALDNALERSISPELRDDLRRARYQYKNMKTIEPLVKKGTPEGYISPALLLGRVNQSFSDSAYSGAGELGELAQIGQRFLKEPPSSGTSERQAVQRMLGLLGVGGFAGFGSLPFTDPETAFKIGVGTIGLGLGGTAASRVAGDVIDNPVSRAVLLRRAQTGMTPIDQVPLLTGPTGGMLANRFVTPAAPAPSQ